MLYRLSVTGIDWGKRHVRVGLSKRQIADSPPIDADEPVSRQREMICFDRNAPEYGPTSDLARMPDDGVW